MSDKRFNPDLAQKLFSEERQKMLPADQIIDLVQVDKDNVVADLGAGNGYFTVPFAKKTNHVYAVDIEPIMLEMLEDYANQEGISNIDYVISDLEDIKMDSGQADVVFVAFVIHEVEEMDKVLREIRRILRLEGKLILLEWKPEEHPEMGPPSHERIAPEDLIATLQNYGFDSSLMYENDKVYGVRALFK